MGLGNKFKEVKKAYTEANKLLGDLIKVRLKDESTHVPQLVFRRVSQAAHLLVAVCIARCLQCP